MTLTPNLRTKRVAPKVVAPSEVAKDLNSWTRATPLTSPAVISEKLSLSSLERVKATTRSKRNMSVLRTSSEC